MECWDRCGPVLPTSLVDLLDTTERELEDEEEEEEEEEFDSDDSIENDDWVLIR